MTNLAQNTVTDNTLLLQKMKRNGFKWSPTNQAWQRQLTANAIYVTKHLLKSL